MTIQTVATVVGLAAAVSGGAYFMEDRYVAANDYVQQQQIIQKQIRQSSEGIRRQMLEDELFELDFLENQRPLTSLEHAKKARIERELLHLNSD